MAKKSNYLKVHCPIKDLYGLLTVDIVQGKEQITNFQPLEKDVAKDINNYRDTFPPISSYLLPCETTGNRNIGEIDKSVGCKINTNLPFQCLYCSRLQLTKNSSGPYDIYFLLDESGSMSRKDRYEATTAVKKILIELNGMDNTYSFVSWGTNAGYLFFQTDNDLLIDKKLKLYEEGKTGYRGETYPESAFNLIKNDVQKATKPVIIIFVTDGGFHNVKTAKKARDELLMVNDNISIIAIGITGAIQANLDLIGTVKELSKIVGDSSALSKSFIDVADFLLKKNKNI